MDSVVDQALADADLLLKAGFPALIVENFGDAPFFATSVPPETVAAITKAVDAVRTATDLPTGVNVLRNDALSALAIAAVTGSELIRVNILSGLMFTDQGPITGQAAELARKRRALGSEVEVWADILVKHATPPPGTDATQAAIDTIERGGADAVIVSGAGTGSAPDMSRLETVRAAVGPEVRVAVGSGATSETMSDLAAVADTIIVGSATKVDGDATKPVDPERAGALVRAADAAGLL
jgi:membrane complex biogenesis BtpA family protein